VLERENVVSIESAMAKHVSCAHTFEVWDAELSLLDSWKTVIKRRFIAFSTTMSGIPLISGDGMGTHLTMASAGSFSNLWRGRSRVVKRHSSTVEIIARKC